MTPPIVGTLTVLLLAIILFVTDKLRVDLIALLVLATLALTGLVTPGEALSGFSSPAVVTVWAVFILSGGLSRTGVADVLGRQVLRLAGHSEVRLLLVIMIVAAVLSAFMNNVGVAALMLPVVLTLARKISIPPSRLLMPLAIGCLLGGLTTLIGTPPNILASDALQDFGLEPFQLFDFVPVGAIVALAGIFFIILFGRHLLPVRHPIQTLTDQNHGQVSPKAFYGLEERLALVELPADSPLAGKTLAETRLGQTLGLTILGLQRHGRIQMSIQPETILAGADRLLVLGRYERLDELSRTPALVIEGNEIGYERLLSRDTGLAELVISEASPLNGRTITQIDMRSQYGFNVLAILRHEQVYRTNLQQLPLQAGDRLLLHGNRAELTAARLMSDFRGMLNIFVADEVTSDTYHLQERLLTVRIPPNSSLTGKSLVESQLAHIFGLEVLGIVRDGDTIQAPPPDTQLRAGDTLLVEGKPDDLNIMRGLQGLVIKHHLDMKRVELESDSVGLIEAVLSPHTKLVNKSLREINFREKYGLSVLAIWRNGRAYRSDLGDMSLQFGDAFLLYGPREKMTLLSSEPDFLVLHEEARETLRRNRAWPAIGIMLGVILSVFVGWLPISIAAITGAALMVLTGCLSMEEIYHYIDWRAVFLIACMLPLGIAMEQSGTARFLAEGMVAMVGGLGDMALLAGFFLLTTVASQFMPNPVVTVLMAPIAINTAVDLGLSPYALMMVVAIAASASFMSPVGHPANVLIMGPGGYRFNDYIKVGVPLTIVVLLVTLLVLPLVWPL